MQAVSSLLVGTPGPVEGASPPSVGGGRAPGAAGGPFDEARSWPVEALGPAAYARRVAACRPDATVRVGVIVNPRARAVRAAGPALLGPLAASGAVTVCQTDDLASLRAAVARLVARDGVNVLATLGGDGTVHAAVNALLGLARAAGRAAGAPPPPLPRLLVARGGTLNIVARTLGTSGPPDRTLGRLVETLRGAPLACWPSRPLPLLRVESAALGTRYGFVFGSAMVRHALELYDQFGGGHGGLSRLLLEGARGYALGTELWHREGWRLDPPVTPLLVGRATGPTEIRRYAAVVASTVDVAIAGGALCALARPRAPGAFAARIITETRAGALLKMAPALMLGRPVAGALDVPEAASLRLEGSFTLDGEVFPRLDPAAAAPLVVNLAEPLVAVAT